MTTIPELMGMSETAAALGVSRTRVLQLVRKNPDMPLPVAHLACGPIWVADEVREFALTRERSPGRPHGGES